MYDKPRSASSRLLMTLLALFALSTFLPGVASAQANESGDDSPLPEIVVTATKRGSVSERDYAGSISAYSGADLDEQFATGFGEIFKKAAGVNLNPARAGLDSVSIRGITSSTDASTIAQTTVGVYIDDVPMSTPGSDFAVANPYPFDMEAVEILKGPQGTLYGSGSMGGAIRYVTAKPEFDSFRGSFGGSYSTTDSGDPSYTVRGMLNVPLSETFALRVAGYNQELGGFINNTGTGVQDANEATTSGGRLTLGFQPNESWNVYASVMRQDVAEDDHPAVFESTRLQLERSTAISSPLDTEFTLAKLNVNYSGDSLSFSSSTAVLDKKIQNPQDVSRFLGPLLTGFVFGTAMQTGGVPSVIDMVQSDIDSESEAFSQEFRLFSDNDGGFNWLVGVFYQDTDSDLVSVAVAQGMEDAMNAADGITGMLGTFLFPGDLVADVRSKENSTELAVFGEAIFDLSDRWELTVGGRYYENEIEADRQTFAFGAPGDVASVSKPDGFTPKVVLKYDASDNATIYVRAVEGYRNGGENLVVNPLTGEQFPGYDPDTVWNYEAGTKFDLLDGALRLDLTAFALYWDDLQLPTLDPNTGVGFTANIGEAESKGLEFLMQWAATDNLVLTSAGSWIDTETKDDVLTASGLAPSGTKLPGTPEFQLSTNLEFSWPVGSRQMMFSVTHKYKAEQFNDIAPTRTELPSYSTVDALLGYSGESYSVNLYGRNLGNTRARESLILTSFGDPDTFIVRPREIGLQFDLLF